MALRQTITIITTIFIVLYPLIVFFGFHLLPIKWLCLTLLCLFALRATLSLNKGNTIIPKKVLFLVAIVGVGFSVVGLISQTIFFIKLYPLIMNLTFLLIFFSSLLKTENILYQLAKKTSTKPLPAFVKNYTRKVTITWCIFFGINSMLSLYTALFSSIHVWTIYNGFISYIAIGILFGVELSIRTYIKRKHKNE